MKFEPDENTLFEKSAPRRPIFIIRISAIPAIIYLALLGLSVLASIQITANSNIALLTALFPIALILWSVFLVLSFLSVVALFISRIHLYPDALQIRGIFRWGHRRDIPLHNIKSVSTSIPRHNQKHNAFGTLHIRTNHRSVVIPWVHDPKSARKAIDTARSGGNDTHAKEIFSDADNASEP